MRYKRLMYSTVSNLNKPKFTLTKNEVADVDLLFKELEKLGLLHTTKVLMKQDFIRLYKRAKRAAGKQGLSKEKLDELIQAFMLKWS